MDKATMERLGITPVKKIRNGHGTAEDIVLVNKHADGAVSVGYTKAVAELIIGGSVKEKYIQFGYSPNGNRLYMWGDSDGFTVSYNRASSARCYTSSKSLASVLPESGYPYKCKLEFDPLAKCYFCTLKN